MAVRNRNILRDYGIAIVAAVAIAIFIRSFVVEAYRIPTPSMRPTLEPGDTIFVLKAPTVFNRKTLKRGDVIVFESPADPGRDYIKRVLGLPGDLVQVRKGRVTLNGKLLAIEGERQRGACFQETLPTSPQNSVREFGACWEHPALEDFGPEKVPTESVFVIGDFRSRAPADAKTRRGWGMIPIVSVKGKAHWIWLSVEPQGPGDSAARFPNLRFERMLRRID